MKRRLLAVLSALSVLVTGCPRQEYIVELTPRGGVIERKVTFYQADGADTNGVPNYQTFPSNELAAIARAYPPGNLLHQGDRHLATGTFAGALPADIGGAGTYSNFATSLGSAGLYLERFRGNDDLATVTERRLKAADRLTDLVLGWSRAELGREPRYSELRTFLDAEFRRDLKNLCLYWAQGQISSVSGSNAEEEFLARYGLYLIEHGYLKTADLPDLFHSLATSDDRRFTQPIRRIVAEKLHLPANGPMPKSLAFLAGFDAMQASWEKYLASTEEYSKRLWKWRRDNISGSFLSWNSLKRNVGGIFHPKSKPATAGPPKPQPAAIANELFEELFLGAGAGSDALTVRLTLPSAPLHSNGNWDEVTHKVRWEANLPAASGTNPAPPVFCFATWSEADEAFQKARFGRVILNGEELSHYCLWLGGLTAPRVAEWNAMIAGLQPGDATSGKLDAFHFADELNAASPAADSAAYGRQLLQKVWSRESAPAGK